LVDAATDADHLPASGQLGALQAIQRGVRGRGAGVTTNGDDAALGEDLGGSR
jgi:hypothetical protein